MTVWHIYNHTFPKYSIWRTWCQLNILCVGTSLPILYRNWLEIVELGYMCHTRRDFHLPANFATTVQTTLKRCGTHERKISIYLCLNYALLVPDKYDLIKFLCHTQEGNQCFMLEQSRHPTVKVLKVSKFIIIVLLYTGCITIKTQPRNFQRNLLCT